MSALSKSARAKAEEKVERLTRSNSGKIDASGWREPLGEMGQVQTGERPISRRQFKTGGKVTGSKAVMHAGRKPRASGGLTANSLINRDVRKANDERDGSKHIGGFKKGGRPGKFVGGPMMGRPGMPASQTMAGAGGGRPMPQIRPGMRPYAKGGKVGHPRDCKCCGGASGAYADGGPVYGGTRPTGDRMPRAKGGRAKKSMNVNIVIAPQGGGGAPRPGMPPPPGMGPVGLHQGVPAPPPAMAPPGAPPPMGAPPPQMRKSGGRAYPIDTGAGGGRARLEKIRAYAADEARHRGI